MIRDPLVQEVRETRAKIFEECGSDLTKLLDRYQEAERLDQHRLITQEEFRALYGPKSTAASGKSPSTS